MSKSDMITGLLCLHLKEVLSSMKPDYLERKRKGWNMVSFDNCKLWGYDVMIHDGYIKEGDPRIIIGVEYNTLASTTLYWFSYNKETNQIKELCGLREAIY